MWRQYTVSTATLRCQNWQLRWPGHLNSSRPTGRVLTSGDGTEEFLVLSAATGAGVQPNQGASMAYAPGWRLAGDDAC